MTKKEMRGHLTEMQKLLDQAGGHLLNSNAVEAARRLLVVTRVNSTVLRAVVEALPGDD